MNTDAVAPSLFVTVQFVIAVSNRTTNVFGLVRRSEIVVSSAKQASSANVLPPIEAVAGNREWLGGTGEADAACFLP